VADKDHRAADPPEATGDAVHVAFQGIQSMLRADHIVALGLQRWNQFAEAGAVGPEAMSENNTRFGHSDIL